MKIYECSHCANAVHFENSACESCGSALGYLPRADRMQAVRENAPHPSPRFCANAADGACNWLVEPESSENYCRACRHNSVIPDLGQSGNRLRWQRIEEAKRRMFYSLLRWRLPIPSRKEDLHQGLAFEFLADGADDSRRVMTGHDDGLITIALSEADDVERERRRTAMGEPYRTLVGHFRHEIGHFYWNLLVRDGGRLAECRALFGDDREDYGEALRRHHTHGPPSDWRESFVSSYATTHPWEDFAETWAHCMHIVDTLETAGSFGLSMKASITAADASSPEPPFDPYEAGSFERIVTAWRPLSIAVNAINRSMGTPDVYPFVLNAAVVAKLAFVHGVIREAGV